METKKIGASITILHRTEQRYVMQKMKEYGISYSSYNFLLYIAHNEGCSQKEMCEELVIDEALAVRVMSTLSAQGYIKREKSQENARRYEISLTKSGHELMPKLRACLAGWWSQVVEGTSGEELFAMVNVLESMAKKSVKVLKDSK